MDTSFLTVQEESREAVTGLLSRAPVGSGEIGKQEWDDQVLSKKAVCSGERTLSEFRYVKKWMCNSNQF